jgi:hypothetical protein
MTKGLRSLADIIGGGLKDLERRASAAIHLSDRVRAALTGPEKDHVLSASYRGETLVVVMDSAVWCPQVRYAQEQLLNTLRAAGETQFTKVKVRVGSGDND